MRNRFWIGLSMIFLIPGVIFVTSCAKKPVKPAPSVVTPQAAKEAEAKRLAAEKARAAQKALEEQRIREERLRAEAKARREREEIARRERFVSEHIHFEFDKSRLLPEAKEILRRKAKWLKENPDVSVIIEGHCDERGTNEYNMALGDRRAHSAKSYLIDLGIAPERMKTISYGEERPFDPRHNEEAWAKNRRDQFVIQ